MSAYSEALALQETLPKSGAIAWQIGKMYNALLAAAKEAEPDSISIGALDPLTAGPNDQYIAGVGADSLRAMIAVVAAALKPPPFVGIA